MKRKFLLPTICIIFVLCGACGRTLEQSDVTSADDALKEVEVSIESDAENSENNISEGETQVMEKIKAMEFIKNPKQHNPVYTQKYSADPYGMVYDGRVYLYMTGDEPMYDAKGEKITNNYSNINTIRVISSDDLVNWTNHGEVFAAGKNGAATWGGNSWAPAACWKMVDGKPKFFLYFANSGNGIAVLTADSPVGPFTDPIGKALISRETPTCAEVAWLFDPAVLVDDDGSAYIYFGGGIPSPDMIKNPGTARVAKLADDMVSLDGDPKPIENVLYLFEDSGINKINGKYIYSYCSNFNVPEGGCEGHGFDSGEIVTMVSDDPMGPFETIGGVLKNPGFFFKNGGNNHHCMFEFEGKWYITYHASLIEEKLGLSSGYRSVNIDKVTFKEDGNIGFLRGTKEGVEQLKSFDPYKETSFTTMSNQVGTDKVAADENAAKYGSGNFNLKIAEEGSWTEISGADFGEKGATKLVFTVKGGKGTLFVRTTLNGDDLGYASFDAFEDFTECELTLDKAVSGVNDYFFVFAGEGYQLGSYRFE